MDLYDQIKEAVDQIIAKYKEMAVDGLTIIEILKLAYGAVATLVQLVQGYEDYTGEQKKEAVLKALERVFDEVISPIDIKRIPNIIEPIIDKGLKELVLTLADPLIDQLVNIFNKTGWSKDGAPAVDVF